VFFDINKGSIIYTGCNLRNREGGGDEKGPNEARRFVWALGEFFLFIIIVFLILITLTGHNLRDGERDEGCQRRNASQRTRL
jgi:hypothetical protein